MNVNDRNIIVLEENIFPIDLENRPILQRIIQERFAEGLRQKFMDNIHKFHVVKFCDNKFLLNINGKMIKNKNGKMIKNLNYDIAQNSNYDIAQKKHIIDIISKNTKIDFMCEDGIYRSGRMWGLYASDGCCIIEI